MSSTTTGATAAPMTDAEAAWVRALAWQAYHRRDHQALPTLTTTCRCQWGPCGHCDAGRHELCAQAVVRGPVTWITGPTGLVVDATTAAVYEAGHEHPWRCPCVPQHRRRWTEPTLWD